MLEQSKCRLDFGNADAGLDGGDFRCLLTAFPFALSRFHPAFDGVDIIVRDFNPLFRQGFGDFLGVTRWLG